MEMENPKIAWVPHGTTEGHFLCLKSCVLGLIIKNALILRKYLAKAFIWKRCDLVQC